MAISAMSSRKPSSTNSSLSAGLWSKYSNSRSRRLGLRILIADGVSTETIYQLNDEGLAHPVEVRTYQPGEVCAVDEPDIHRVSNDSDSELINVHVYTPPYTLTAHEPAPE